MNIKFVVHTKKNSTTIEQNRMKLAFFFRV